MKPIRARSHASSTSSEWRSVEVVAVLHGHDLDDPARLLELVDAKRSTCPTWRILPSSWSSLSAPTESSYGTCRVGRVQLVEVDAVELQPPQAGLAALPRAAPAARRAATGRDRSPQAALRRDHEPVRVRMERLGDQVLAHLRAVRVRRVDQVDAELDDAPEEALGLLRVVGRAPDAVARDPHGAEAEAVNLEVTADGEGVHAD